jgi:Lar family restriction alleviation protein
MPNELKPCPFCGSDVKIVFNRFGSLYMCFCETCGAIVSFKGKEGKIALRNAWNERADDE